MYPIYRLEKQGDSWFFYKEKVCVVYELARSEMKSLNSHTKEFLELSDQDVEKNKQLDLFCFTSFYWDKKTYFIDPLPIFEIKKRGIAKIILVEQE